MPTLSKLMFGRRVEVRATGEVGDQLAEELSLYPDAGQGPVDLRIEHAPLPAPAYPATPRQHAEVESGFVVRRAHASACFQKPPNDVPRACFTLADEGNAFRRLQRKWNNIQYTSRTESVGQVFHELVLLPALHFFEDLVPLHASALRLISGEVVALGGTGGIGKTSLELELCRRRGAAFMADDIAVLDAEGRLWPNFNHPKIYAYNVQNDARLERRLIPAGALFNRAQWEFRRRRGGERVRRRISPLELYGQVEAEARPLTRYFLLVPDRVERPMVERISAERASEMTLAVLRSEFGLFHSHIGFHEFNCLARGAKPVLTVSGVFEAWRRRLVERTNAMDCALLRIPPNLPHEAFKKLAGDLVTAPLP